MALILLGHCMNVAAQQKEATAADEFQRAEKLAVAFLAKEVPAWRPANQCFSCHNNGDGTRALLLAASANGKIPVEPSSTQETIAFLQKPSIWESNGPDGEFNDRQLARVQFAHALMTATDLGVVRDHQPLLAAAVTLAANQSQNGSWEFSGEDVIGSPVTYGRPLATAVAVQVLRQADSKQFAKPIAAAESWLINLEPASVLNSAAILIGLHDCTSPAVAAQRARCVSIIGGSQTHDGGWGPYVNSPPEPFDTAIVLCALIELDRKDWGKAIQAGRQFLRQTQLADGSWTETTRPAGRESYAQRIATTAWATIALIKSR
jgi:hypothetical protein